MTVRLSDLFGRHEDLMVVHNMGSSCPGCTLWADGYNGVHHHVVTRAAFVVSSPDPPDVQEAFAASRGWRFLMWTLSPLVSPLSANSGQTPLLGGQRKNAVADLYLAKMPKPGAVPALNLALHEATESYQ